MEHVPPVEKHKFRSPTASGGSARDRLTACLRSSYNELCGCWLYVILYSDECLRGRVTGNPVAESVEFKIDQGIHSGWFP
jgi:hypothetical protein